MAKYTFEFKKKVVNAYLQGEGSYNILTKKYGLPPGKDIRKWVNAYKAFGDDGLMRSKNNKNYSFEFKVHVVELYLTTDISYQELALQIGTTNPSLITKWVNDYRIAGPDALRPRRKGRRPKVDKQKNIAADSDHNTDYIRQLENELLKLRIENAYLKELRRLRLEEEALLKKQRESSTASEENLN